MSKNNELTGADLKALLNEKEALLEKLFEVSSSEKREFNTNEKKEFEALQQELFAIEKDLEATVEAENKLVKVEFLKSPTGIYNLAYSAKDKAKVKAVIAKKMIEDGTAKKVK